MAFTFERMIEFRPYLYHLTARRNVSRIRRTGELHSAGVLLEQAGEKRWIRKRRKNAIVVNFDGDAIHVRDQAPLHEGSMALEDGITFGDFVKYVNGFVFFWPGKEDKPIKSGLNYFERYRDERPAILRIPLSDLAQEEKKLPLFGKYNSGAPRCVGGLKSPRGRDTFLKCTDAPFTVGTVTEVVYPKAVQLPKTTRISNSFGTSWTKLFPR